MSGDATAEPSPPEVPPIAPRRARRRGLWVLAALLLALVLVLAAALATAFWAARSSGGSAWLLTKLPGLTVTQPRGALWGDFDARRIEIVLPSGDRIVLIDAGWREPRFERLPGSGLWGRLGLTELHAAQAQVLLKPSTDTSPLQPPASLALPLEIDIASLRIGRLDLEALGEQPLRDLQARVHLGADGGAQHRVEGLTLAWDKLQAQASARIASRAPFVLEAQATLAQAVAPAASAASAASSPPSAASAALPEWRATARLSGPLAQPLLNASVQARATPAQAEQSLAAEAELRPFDAWPLGRLQASTTALDLSALSSAAPRTALTGTATAATRGLDQPATLALSLENDAAGLWNEARLPLRRITAQLVARPGEVRSIRLPSFDIALGSAARPAGQIAGTAQWSPKDWRVDATLTALQPSLLDARAAPMRLNGPLTVASQGFALNAPGSATFDVKADLAGDLAAAVSQAVAKRVAPARAVRLKLDASVGAQRLELREALAVAGGARAALAGLATRAPADGPWQLKGRASLVDFDPLPWWPGRDDSPWRRGPHRLNANAEFDLTLPAAAAASPAGAKTAAAQNVLPPWLSTLRGSATLAVSQSLLAGVPLRGDASLRNAAGQAQAALAANIDLAGNALKLAGRVGTSAGSGAGDSWELALNAPALQRLSPLWRLLQAPGAAAPKTSTALRRNEPDAVAGSLSANATVKGRWPELSAQGQLDGTGLRAGTLGVQRAEARWQLGSAADATIDVQATLTNLSHMTAASTAAAPARAASGAASGAAQTGAGVSLDSLQLSVKGSAASHRIEVRGESRLLPPAWVDVLQAAHGAAVVAAPAAAASAGAAAAATAAPARGRSTALLQAQGGLIDLPGARAAGWRGSVQQLEARAGQQAPWLRARDLAFEASWSGAAPRVAVQPGRIELLGAALRWTRLAWQGAFQPPNGGAAQPMQIDAQAEFDPVPVAPLLARLQPDFGWGGDLLLTGRLNVRSAPSFSADIVVERARGDLTVTDEISTQALQLTDLRLALNAQDGVWNFTQALAGKTLGVAAGAVVARTSPQATWPAADTPIQGVIELQVANLGAWGNWVPAGWRLIGSLRTSASIGGRFGAPEYTGEVRGAGLGVRNFLQGVNVSDGDVSIALQGATARIEHFSARAGNGTVTLEGNAALGETPRAQLKLRADKFQLLGRVDRRIVASGDAQLQLERDAVTLGGNFSVDEGLIDFTRSDAPSLSDDVHVVRSATGAAAQAAAAKAQAAANAAPATTPRSVALNLQVELGRQLRLRGRGLDTGLRGELHISSPGGKLAVNGSVSTADGTYAAYGQKLSIDRGSISFNGPVENPRLDIEATRPNTDTRVGVLVTGTALNPRIRLFSEPEVSDLDKLSWLVLGRASDGLGRADTALLQRAAVALLAGEGGGITDQFTKAIGLDDVSLRQTDGEVRETVISLGKQLSRRWYVGYERGLNTTAGTWQLIYRIAQRFTLRAQSGLDNSLDVIWTWRWQ